MEKYLVVLNGMGDTEVFLVGKEIFDWINLIDLIASGRKGKESHWDDEQTPQSLRDAIIKEESGWGDNSSGKVNVTIGSFSNDKAISSSRVAVGNFIASSERKLLAWAKKQDYELAEEEFRGMIY